MKLFYSLKRQEVSLSIRVSGFRMKYLFLFMLCMFQVELSAQEQPRETQLLIPAKTRNFSYFMPYVGIKNQTFRDFATSPLFYRGPAIELGLSWRWGKKNWENVLETDITFAYTFAKIPESAYFQTHSNALFFSGKISDEFLVKIQKLSWKKFDTKVGGTLLSTMNFRKNSALNNNGIGIENLTNLMATASISKDISRTETKERKYLGFIKKTLLPVERHLSFKLNVGVLNFNYRPGYAYISDSELDGSNSNGLKSLLEGYSWKMNGWRLGTTIEFTKMRPNGNGHKWAYIWTAANAPGKFEAFQIASHSLRYTLIINKKK